MPGSWKRGGGDNCAILARRPLLFGHAYGRRVVRRIVELATDFLAFATPDRLQRRPRLRGVNLFSLNLTVVAPHTHHGSPVAVGPGLRVGLFLADTARCYNSTQHMADGLETSGSQTQGARPQPLRGALRDHPRRIGNHGDPVIFAGSACPVAQMRSRHKAVSRRRHQRIIRTARSVLCLTQTVSPQVRVHRMTTVSWVRNTFTTAVKHPMSIRSCFPYFFGLVPSHPCYIVPGSPDYDVGPTISNWPSSIAFVRRLEVCSLADWVTSPDNTQGKPAAF